MRNLSGRNRGCRVRLLRRGQSNEHHAGEGHGGGSRTRGHTQTDPAGRRRLRGDALFKRQAPLPTAAFHRLKAARRSTGACRALQSGHRNQTVRASCVHARVVGAEIRDM